MKHNIKIYKTLIRLSVIFNMIAREGVGWEVNQKHLLYSLTLVMHRGRWLSTLCKDLTFSPLTCRLFAKSFLLCFCPSNPSSTLYILLKVVNWVFWAFSSKTVFLDISQVDYWLSIKISCRWRWQSLPTLPDMRVTELELAAVLMYFTLHIILLLI